ncbi:MAG TPA: DUF3105 domain-containing protein [Acidimicrobiales bacterium]|nr:DUF3105 domain-containing protein [Acidimicrobiales bacterium]
MAQKKKPNRPRPPAGPRAGGSRPAPKPAAKPAPNASAKGAPKPASNAAAAKPAAKVRERTGPTRSERLAAAEAARRRKATRTRAIVWGAAAAIMVLLVVTIVASRRSNDAAVAKLEASGSCKYDTKTDSDGGTGNNHVEGDVTYKTNPPSGGNHNPTPAPAGVFTATNTPPDAQLVHSLEHGYIIIWYKPDIPSTQLDDLKSLTGRYSKDVLLVPRASLGEPVAATAWHRRLLCSQNDLTALESFVTSYRNKGPEKIPH